MLKNKLWVLISGGAAALVLAFYGYTTSKPTNHVHYHAGFMIYIDDELQDYSNYKYMNFVPCSEHEAKKSPEEEQIELAHLHDSVGDVVHVHRSGAKWGDLLTNAGIVLPAGKAIKGFVDGVAQVDILSAPIDAYTTAVLLVGESTSERANERVSLEHIKEVEAKSELCASN